MQPRAMALHEELYNTLDNRMDSGPSKRALKHGLQAQKNVMDSIRTMELQGVPVNRAWDFKLAALLLSCDSAVDKLFLIRSHRYSFHLYVSSILTASWKHRRDAR